MGNASARWLVRHCLLIISVLLYVVCLPFDAFCVSHQCSNWPAWGILIFGPLGLPSGAVANWTWLANPALFSAWIFQFVGERLVAAILGFIACAIAVSFLFLRDVVTNEGGVPFPITGYRVGYWIWLSSMILCWFNSLAAIELSRARRAN
jgi:hypothetical protein